MVLAVVELDLEVHHGDSRPGSPLHARLLDALLHRGDVVPGDGAAEDVVHELEVAAARQRLHPDLAVAELAAAAGLLLVPAVALGRGLDRLPVGDLRLLEVDLDLVCASAWPPPPRCGAGPCRRAASRGSAGRGESWRTGPPPSAGAARSRSCPRRRASWARWRRWWRARGRRSAGRRWAEPCRRACRPSGSPSAWPPRRCRPRAISGTGVCVLPCSIADGPSRSPASRVALCTVESALQRARVHAEQADAARVGSAMVLNTNAESGRRPPGPARRLLGRRGARARHRAAVGRRGHQVHDRVEQRWHADVARGRRGQHREDLALQHRRRSAAHHLAPPACPSRRTPPSGRRWSRPPSPPASRARARRLLVGLGRDRPPAGTCRSRRCRRRPSW